MRHRPLHALASGRLAMKVRPQTQQSRGPVVGPPGGEEGGGQGMVAGAAGRAADDGAGSVRDGSFIPFLQTVRPNDQTATSAPKVCGRAYPRPRCRERL
jgi:hypothetical protein